jgi:hypothetical protein
LTVAGGFEWDNVANTLPTVRAKRAIAKALLAIPSSPYNHITNHISENTPVTANKRKEE